MTFITASVLLALVSAVGYGVSDYLSDVFSRRLRFLDVLAVGYTAGLLVFVAAWPLFGGTAFATRDLVWGPLPVSQVEDAMAGNSTRPACSNA
ncbi:MAG: hypothetical protein WD382_01515 [Halofilum sp. (in: g-proteobacteria)]